MGASRALAGVPVALGLLLGPFAVAPAAAGEEPSIRSVDPARYDARLDAIVRTSRLPGERIASSLESGLPSAVEMRLDLRDADDRIVAERVFFYRIAFDLWEELFRVEGPGADDRRFESLDAVRGFLDELPRLPVARFGEIEAGTRHRLRVGCRLHPVAPRETERLGEWVGGEPDASERERNARAADEREVSVSLGKIIRFFYRGSGSADEADERFSAWFVPDELPDDAVATGADGDGDDDGSAAPRGAGS
jgi:hypothetical protein